MTIEGLNFSRRTFLYGAGASLALGAQTGSFIWTGETTTPRNRFVAFRHALEVTGAPGEPALHIFADTRYVAFLNGEYLASGPARFDPRFPEYDTLPLAGLLKPGRNVLAVLVHTLGQSNAWSIAHQPGLTFHVEWKDAEGRQHSVSSSPEARWCAMDAWDSQAPVGWPWAAEWFDASKYPDKWATPGFDDKGWRTAVLLRQPTWGPLQPRSIPLLRETVHRPVTQSFPAELAEGQSLIVDFGNTTLARPVLTFEATAGVKLELNYADTLEDRAFAPDRYICRAGRQTWSTTDVRGFRYLIVTARRRGARLVSASATERLYPVEQRGRFHSSDPLLNTLWTKSVETVRVCMEDAYVDTPFRERAQWLADAVTCGFHTNLAAFGDTALFRRLLRQIGESQDQTGILVSGNSEVLTGDYRPRFPRSHREPGWIWAHYPADRNDIHRYIEDYMLLWVIGIRDYYTQTNDLGFVRSQWPRITRVLEWFDSHRTPRGLVRAREFVYFGNPVIYQTGEGATVNLFCLMALKAAAELAGCVGVDASVFTRRAGDLARAIRAHFECDGLLLAMIDGEKTWPPSVHANVLAVLAGIVPPEGETRVLDWIESHLPGETISPYMFFWISEMLYRLGDTGRAERVLLDEIRKHWGPLASLPGVRESFSPRAPTHLAGSAPAWVASGGVLGVRVIEHSGRRELCIRPRLGELEWAEGAVPTTLGLVEVRHARLPGEWKSTIRVPPGAPARFALPSEVRRETLRLNGQQASPVLDQDLWWLTLPPGNHVIEAASRLIASFDCTRDYPPSQYFANGQTQIIKSDAGHYREAEAKPQARFGYRFRVRNPGQPHVTVIRYPDDKRRYMCVMDGTSYDLTTGVFTGYAQPLSGRMLEIRQVFWPRWTDASLTFMTWGEGEPAAIARVEVFEIDALPPLQVPAGPGDRSRRELGIQYEDPCGTGASEGALTREQWIDHVVSYARHTGQSLLVYPVAWYHGPQFRSEREPSDGFDVVVAPDRRQYIRWTSKPADWYAHLLDRFGREGLGFQASLTLLRLGSLMQRMNIDLDSIRTGTETINNLLWNDNVQAGTQDWTPVYNVRNYPKALEFHAKGAGDLRGFPWAYGEKNRQPYHPGPIFNPLHPVVQDAIVGFAGEIAARYARYPAFLGISFNMWHATILWYGSLHSGYDDYTVGLFEKDTGISVPGNRKAPDRFSRRYEFLTRNCRPIWIAWRCEKLRGLYRRIRDAVTAARSDLRVVFTFWNETTVPALYGQLSAATQLDARPNTIEVWRLGGFDPALMREEHGIEIDLTLDPSRDRGWDTAGTKAPLERTSMFRDHDFLDSSTLDMMRSLDHPGAYIFNSWVEAWGEHRWFACGQGEPQPLELAVMDGKPAEGIFRINSEYPKDGFWWDSQLRITPAFQGGPHFLEHYAHSVAEFDALRITRGGLFLDKAHSREIGSFARSYRALPAKKFETVGGVTDPVAVRQLLDGGRRYFYVVNREYYPIAVEIRFDHAPTELVDLATGASLRPAASLHLFCGPYELRSFALPPEAAIAGFRADPPVKIVEALLADAKQALHDLKQLRAAGRVIAGMDRIETGLEPAIQQRRLAWLRRALSSYAVRKCREELGRGALSGLSA